MEMTAKEQKRLEGIFFVYGFESSIPEDESDLHLKLDFLLRRISQDIIVIHNAKFLKRLEKQYAFVENIYYSLDWWMAVVYHVCAGILTAVHIKVKEY